YYGGIDVRSGADVTFQPGTYILAGGGFSVSSNGKVTGAGVMFYNTLNPTQPNGAGAFGAISVSSTRPVVLSAPTAGTYGGILFFQDRLNTIQASFTAGANGKLDGVIYAAAANVHLQAGADLLYTQIVAGSLSLQGGPVLNLPTTPLLFGGNGAALVAWQDY
ncbi:MAG: hypothetical protein ACREQ9_16265, partial [Candidatus Binatia bacterium]